MFTGIVEEIGQVESVKKKASGLELGIRCEKIIEDLRVGDSVAVEGVCLTVTGIKGQRFTADVSRETLKRTDLGGFRVGTGVNLERAVRAEARFGGHIVNGHVDVVGSVTRRFKRDGTEIIKIRAPREIVKYLVAQGSVAVDGISLTVLETLVDGFTVAVIPYTTKSTTLGKKKTGAKVNIEVDIIGKYISSLVGQSFSSAKRKAR